MQHINATVHNSTWTPVSAELVEELVNKMELPLSHSNLSSLEADEPQNHTVRGMQANDLSNFFVTKPDIRKWFSVKNNSGAYLSARVVKTILEHGFDNDHSPAFERIMVRNKDGSVSHFEIISARERRFQRFKGK